MQKRAIIASLLVVLMLIGVFTSIRLPTGNAASLTGIDIAITRGLVYLASVQKPDGSWPGPYGEDDIGTTAMAVLAFENGHHLPDNVLDPYYMNVARGLSYLLSQANVQSIGLRPAGNPDTNGNGIGIYFDDFIDGSVSCYETPMVLMALVASQNASRVATTGPANVVGRTYHDIVTDMVDWIAWSQNDYTTGIYEGGWRYHPYYGSSDMSVTQWPVLGLLTAEFWNINAPSWVQTELAKWLAVDQNFIGNPNSNYIFGCFYYEPYNQLDDIADCAAGILGLTYCGVNSTDSRIVAAEGYITRDWYTAQGTGGWRNNFGDFYPMYSIMKTMELTLPFPTKYVENYAGSSAIEWYNGTNQYADWLIANQHADGSWMGTNNPEEGATGQNLDTAWGTLILEHIPVIIPYPLLIQVVDAYSENPIAGANVSISGPENRSEITNMGGFAFFNGSQAGKYFISASKAGYIPVAGKTVDLTQVECVTIELAQTGPFNLKVNVANSCNQPIGNAYVKVANSAAFSDASGVVSFNLPRGSYTVTASHEYYEQSSYQVNLTANKDVTLTLGFPYLFKGQIANSNIIITAASSGYDINLLNNLTSSSMDVFFEWNYMGTIPAGTWQTFNFNHLPNLIVEAASEGSPDYPNAWYTNPVPIQLVSPSGTSAFLPEPTPYVAASIFVNPFPPVYGQNATIGVTLHNPLDHPLNLSRVDFQVSGLTVGGDFVSVGFLNNVTLQVNKASIFSIPWFVNVNGHHCVRVVLTYQSDPETIQRNLDVENNVIAGGIGRVNFTLTNPSQEFQQMVVKMNGTLPAGWQARLEINGFSYNMSSDIIVNMSADEQVNCTLRMESSSAVPGEGIVDVRGYINGSLIGGMRKIMQTEPPSKLPVQVTAGNGGSVTVQSSAINGGVPVTVDSGSTQSWAVTEDTTVQLQANPSQGYSFSSWTLTNGLTDINGAPINTSSAIITTAINSGANIQANFEKPRTSTITTVVFSVNPISVNSPDKCTAIVSGLNPTGIVTWSTSSSTGSFSQSESILSSESCSTTYTDTSPGAVTITASYSGDANNAPSSGSATLTVSTSTIEIAFLDDFRKDNSLNTALWSVDSPVLSSIAQKEGAYFTEGITLKAPDLPIVFSSSGLTWSASGVAALTGLTTQAAFTPPFTLQANITLTSATGGNPVALYISNENATTLFAVYLENSIWIVDQGATPIQGPSINENTKYTVTLSVSLSEINVTLTSTSQLYTYTAPLTQSGDYALYASIGSFAGQVPGEAGRSTYSDSAIYSSVMVSSSDLRSLTVHVSASIGGNSAPPLPPSHGALVEVTNRITNQAFTGLTDFSGDYVFTNLVTGTYFVSANQSGIVNGFTVHPFNSTSIVVGDSSDPSKVSLNVELDILTPPIDPLSVTLSPNSTVGIFPLSVYFRATPSGWAGNYAVAWFVNGSQVTADGLPLQGLAADINFTAPSLYLVSAQVTSQGEWFGVAKPLETSTSLSVKVVAENAVFFANISPVNNQGLIQLSYNDTYQGQVFFHGSDVYLNTTVMNELAAVDIPDLVQTILGISCPYYGIDFSDSTRTYTVSTNQVEQPYATSNVYTVMPQGTPTNYRSLTNYDFCATLNPSSSWALLYNGVTVLLAALGVNSALSAEKEPLLKILKDSLVDTLKEMGISVFLDTMRLGAAEVVKELVDFVRNNFQTLIQSIITLLKSLGLGLIIDVLAALSGLELARAVVDFTWDLCTVVGAIAKAMLTTDNVQEFTFANVVPGEVVNVDPEGVIPYVTLSGQNMLAGWRGGWIGSSGAFIHSAIVDGVYSFAVPYGNYTLTITAPPGVSQANYIITVTINGINQTVDGIVQAGIPIQYKVNFSKSGLTMQYLKHDVAITNVKASINDVYQGWKVPVNVTVANLGNATETFNVSLYYNTSMVLIGTQTVFNLAPNATTQLRFMWNTAYVPVCYTNYTITAKANIIPGETDIANNVLTDGSVRVRIMGDVNADGIVNVQDFILIAKCLGSSSGHFGDTPVHYSGPPAYSFYSDLNQDGRANILDLIICATHLGQHW